MQDLPINPNPLEISREEWLKNAIEACKRFLKEDPGNGYWKMKLNEYRKELACLS